MIPYTNIIEEANRRWTPRLLDRLTTPGLGEEELDQLGDALAAVSDPRAVSLLESVRTPKPEEPPADQLPAYVDKYRDLMRRLNYTAERFAAAYSVAIRVRPRTVRGH